MKKFRYALEPLLKIRRFHEKQEFSRYGRVLGEINRHIHKISEVKEQKQEFIEIERSQMAAGYFNLADKAMAGQYYNNIAKVIISEEKEIESRKDEVESLRKIAEKARQNRRVLEILKEKKENEYRDELKKFEFKELDEFNQRKHRKN